MADENKTAGDPIESELLLGDSSFADIVDNFVEGLGGRLRSMFDAIRAVDFEGLRNAAHQLKGSGGGYGYPILSQQAAELERHAKARVLEECTTALNELKELCGRVVVTADR
jgi:HPt (histidine-containing phosphotransfer) domain-containing protein